MELIPQKEDLRFVRGDDVRVVVLAGSGTAKIAFADGVAAGEIYHVKAAYADYAAAEVTAKYFVQTN